MPVGQQRQFVADWYNESGESNYPFEDSALLRTTDGLELPRDAVLDLVIYPNPGVAPRLTLIEISRSDAVFTFVSETNDLVATGIKTFNDEKPAVTLYDAIGRQIGVMVLNEDSRLPFAGWPTGPHNLDLGVVVNCVLPVEAVVEGFSTEDGGYVSGFVYLVGDAGVVVRPDPSPNPGEDAIRIDIVGEPLFRRLACVPQDRFRTPNFVRTINGLSPNSRGEFPIVVGQHLSSEPIVRIAHDKNGKALTFSIIGLEPAKV